MTRARPTLAIAALLVGMAAHAAGVTAGAHVATWHDRPGYRTSTPGLYAMAPSGLTGGLLRNSDGGTSAYAGWTWHTDDAGTLSAAITVGAITGYALGPVLPLAVPSLRIALGRHAALRLIALPRYHPKQGANALNLAIEWSHP